LKIYGASRRLDLLKLINVSVKGHDHRPSALFFDQLGRAQGGVPFTVGEEKTSGRLLESF